jgi:uncharacterized protein (TIGR03083 family)
VSGASTHGSTGDAVAGDPHTGDGPTDAAYRDAIRGASVRLAGVVTNDPDAPVTSCPGWTVGRLVTHVGRIHRWVAIALDTPRGQEVPAVARPPGDTDLAAWLLDGANHLVDAFDAAGPDGSVSSPGWEQPARWWLRRTAQETVMHAWDAQAAVGAPEALAVTMAVDGIDEVMDVFVPAGLDQVAFGPRSTIHLHCTDTHGEWLVTLGQGETVVERRHAKGDVAVRGGASDILLWCWNRVSPDRLELFGDTGVLDRYRDATNF